MNNQKHLTVEYPPVVIAYMNKTMENYLKWRLRGKDEVQLHFSFQPNSHPHLGTITGVMVSFALGEFIREKFSLDSSVLFEQLENAPGYKKKVNGITYQLMLCDTPFEGSTKLDVYMSSFKEIIEWVSSKTGVKYIIMPYKEFQEIPLVRKSLLEIMNHANIFLPILNPTEDQLKIRFPCKKCKFMDEDCKTLIVEDLKQDYAKLSMGCFKHGRYQIEITPDNKEFVDFNTPIRNAIKERLFIELARDKNALNIMVDGSDWVGMGELMNHTLGLFGYTVGDLPTRIFTSLIEDWSGAKFSKSVYVSGRSYDYIPSYLKEYPKFMKEFGYQGLEKLLNETRDWVRDPKKLFRNYTIDYFDLLFKEKI